MVPVTSLWLPILLSAVFVFVASSIVHMVLGYHRNDFRRFSNEDQVISALRPLEIPPGDYAIPCAGSMKAMKDPAFMEKMKAGPVAFMTFAPPGPPSMASSLILWFLYSIVVSVIAGYVARSALRPGAHYLAVFRYAGCVAFTAYSIGLIQDSIWYRRNWGTTLKYVFDGLIYGLLTAGVFGWLWPR
jgi:hypothetical protein